LNVFFLNQGFDLLLKYTKENILKFSSFYPFKGPRYRRPKEKKEKTESDEKRPRTAFSNEQLLRLKVTINLPNYFLSFFNHGFPSLSFFPYYRKNSLKIDI
jgi:hypothetical protein